MVEIMLKKNWFFVAIIILYLLFLCKDHIFGMFDHTQDLGATLNQEKIEYYKREYENISELFNIDTLGYHTVYGRVVLHDIYAFYEEITIGKGTRDGVKLQDLVINQDGVVGVVKKVNDHSSVVELLTSPNMELSVKIGSSYGILSCVDDQVIVKNIKLDQEIQVGDKVYTSGLTSIPGSSLVGTVQEIHTDNLDLEYVLDINLNVNIHDITYVAIIRLGDGEA